MFRYLFGKLIYLQKKGEFTSFKAQVDLSLRSICWDKKTNEQNVLNTPSSILYQVDRKYIIMFLSKKQVVLHVHLS